MVSRDWNPQIGRKLDFSWVLGEYGYELEISKTKTKGARIMASLAENTTSVDISGRAFWRKQYPDASTAFIVFQSGKSSIVSENYKWTNCVDHRDQNEALRVSICMHSARTQIAYS